MSLNKRRVMPERKADEPERGQKADEPEQKADEPEQTTRGPLLCFPAHVLHENMHDETHYFNPAVGPCDWFDRLREKGGLPCKVPRTFVYYYNLNSARRSLERATNICLYTINTGGYEEKVKYRGDTFSSDCDMLYFSDDPALLRHASQIGWTPMYVTRDDGDSKLLQRVIKTQPHQFLPPQYELSIYLDANYTPTFSSVPELCAWTEADTHDMVCWQHPIRTSAAKEAAVVVRDRLETKPNVDAVLKRQLGGRDMGLTETNVLIRKHKRIAKFSDEWRECIEICRRDQVSFDFLCGKHEVDRIRHPYKTKVKVAEDHPHDGPGCWRRSPFAVPPSAPE